MPRATLTKTTGPGPYTHAGVAVTMSAADASNFNQFIASGADVVLAQNTGATGYTVTITSAPDARGRTKDITTEAIAASEIRVYNLMALEGWVQPDGKVYLQASNAAVKFGVIQLPG